MAAASESCAAIPAKTALCLSKGRKHQKKKLTASPTWVEDDGGEGRGMCWQVYTQAGTSLRLAGSYCGEESRRKGYKGDALQRARAVALGVDSPVFIISTMLR